MRRAVDGGLEMDHELDRSQCVQGPTGPGRLCQQGRGNYERRRVRLILMWTLETRRGWHIITPPPTDYRLLSNSRLLRAAASTINRLYETHDRLADV